MRPTLVQIGIQIGIQIDSEIDFVGQDSHYSHAKPFSFVFNNMMGSSANLAFLGFRRSTGQSLAARLRRPTPAY